MDLLFFLNKRLELLNYFYEATASVFAETKRKIEAGEEPYTETSWGDPEEPPFQEEWDRAHSATDMAGVACLDLLQSTLHQFLDEFMREIGGKHIIPRVREMQKKSWFGDYREFFLKELEIDWTASGADIDLLEQVILARNDFTHNFSFTTLAAFQSASHSRKYPVSAFVGSGPATSYRRLTVQRDTLDNALATLRQLCTFLERERGKFLKRVRRARNSQESI